MRSWLLSLAILITLLLAACGDSNAVSTATIPPTTAAAPLAALTSTPQPTATSEPTPTVPPTATPQPTATVVSAVTQAPTEATEPTYQPRQQANVDPGSALAIPATYLEGRGLELLDDPQTIGEEDAARLREYKGRQLFQNLWGQDPPNGLIVVDTRWEFGSADGARKFLRYGAGEVEASSDYLVKELPDRLAPADESLAFTGKGEVDGQARKVYLFLWRTGKVVGGVLVEGEKTLSKQQAFDIGERAVRQVAKALGRG